VSNPAALEAPSPRNPDRNPDHLDRRSTRKPKGALLLLLCVLACGPSDPLEEIRLQQERGGNAAATVEPLREMIDAGNEDPEVYYRYGVALLADGDYALAPWPLREAMKSPEWLAKAGLTLAVAYVSNGDYDGAIDATSAVLAADPDDLEALALRADARVRSRRQYEEALVDTERILEVDPDHLGALTSRTVALLGLGRAEQAAELLETLEGSYSDDTLGLHGSPTLCVANATFAKEKGELEMAEERFEACAETFP
jgi:tetratricopeptide (TPR) repeat protein